MSDCDFRSSLITIWYGILPRTAFSNPYGMGSVGVIDGEYQYVVYLGNQKGILRPLAEVESA